jgi:histone deacetylase 1/2
MASNPGIFPSSQPLLHSSQITVGNGAQMPVTHRASMDIATARSPLHLNNILVSPSLVKNLISVRTLTRDNNVSVEFDPFGFSIKDLPTRTELLRCESRGELYPLASTSPEAHLVTTPNVELWHQRLGHPGRHTLQQYLPSLTFTSDAKHSTTCEACQLGKHVRLPFSSSNSISYVPFQIIHADVWTSPVVSLSGFKYYLVLIDDYTHYIWTFPLRAKSEVLQCLLYFHAYVTTQFQLPLIALQTDNGREFDNQALRDHLARHGIAFRLSCPYTSAQNGKAERIIRTVNDCIRSLLIHAGMPAQYWAEALNTATHLLNRRPCQTSGTATPYQLLLGAPPSYSELRVFGCLCYPNQSATVPHKLSPRSLPCVLLGYPADHRGYRCLDLQSRRVITSRHVVFDETQFPFRSMQLSAQPTIAGPATVSDETVILQNPIQTCNVHAPAVRAPTSASPRAITPASSSPAVAPSPQELSPVPSPAAESSGPAAASPSAPLPSAPNTTVAHPF